MGVLLLIKKDEKGWWYTSSNFDYLKSDVVMSVSHNKIKDPTRKIKLSKVGDYLERIDYDLHVLLNICLQANWHKTMTLEGNLDTFHNMKYGAILVDAFLTRYRSTYDTIANAFKEIARWPDYAPTSFPLVRKECRKANNVKIYGEDLACLIETSDWFDQTKKVRDGIVHKNFETSGFMHSRILFQVSESFKNKINFPEVMINKNLVDFELYAAVHVGYTLWFLEKFAIMAHQILQPIRIGSDLHSYHDGLGVLHEWIERVIIPSQTK